MPPLSQRLRDVLVEPVVVGDLTLRLARLADLHEATVFLAAAEAGAHETALRNGIDPIPSERLASEFIRQGEIMIAEDGGGSPIGIFRVSPRNLTTTLSWAFAPGWAAQALHPLVDALVARLAESRHDRVAVHLTGTAPAARSVLTNLGFAHPEFGGNTRDYVIDGATYAERLAHRGECPRWAEPRGRGVVSDQVRIVEPFERKPRAARDFGVREAFAIPFEGNAFTLRLAGYEDVDAIWGLDPDKVPLPDGQQPSILELGDHCSNDKILVAEDASGTMVGSVSVRSLYRGIFAMGWQVRPDRRGEGLGTAMAEAVAGRLFEVGASRLSCGVSADNEPSLRIAGRLGFPTDAEPVRGIIWMDMDRDEFEARPRSDAPALR